jgi:hypothetical protein
MPYISLTFASSRHKFSSGSQFLSAASAMHEGMSAAASRRIG